MDYKPADHNRGAGRPYPARSVPGIDLHAHLLPGVDDGPESVEAALELAYAAATSGTAHIVATPHVNADRFIAPDAIAPAVADLSDRIAEAGIDLRVHAGAEVALPRLQDLDDEALALLRLGDGPYLLLESPFAVHAGDFEAAVGDAQARGHRVLLAHPERCPTFQREPGRLAALVDRGVLVQVTAGVLRGAFGSRTREFAHRLLGDGLVHVLASDAHDTVRRPPGLGDALAHAERAVPGISGREAWLTEEVPAAILAGDPVPEAPPLAPARSAGRRSGGWRLRRSSSAR